MAVKPIPDGYHSVTPYLAVEGADKLIDVAAETRVAQAEMDELESAAARHELP